MQLLHSMLRSWRRQPLRVLIVDDQRSWRGMHLQIAAWHLAREVASRTSAPHIASLLPTSGIFPAVMAAAWTLGRTIVPLNFLLSREELAYILKDCGADTVVTVGPMLDMIGGELPSGVSPMLLEECSFSGLPPIRRAAHCDEDHLAAILYTSGTSGKPKGVMLSAANLAANVDQCRQWAGFTGKDSFLGLLPQFHSFGFTVTTLLPAAVGAPAFYSARFNPRRTLALLRSHRPTAMLAIPSMYNALLASKDAEADDFRSLKYIVSGGEALPDPVYLGFKERFGVTICEWYGLTETAPVTNWCRPHEERRGSVGMPVAGVEERIVDGEVRIRGPNVMGGYYRLPEETAAVFDDDGFFRTGDMGAMDDDGFLRITGRIKEMLIIGGENVFPREIEDVLAAHPAVHAAGVVGRADPSRGEVAVGFVEAAEDAVCDPQALRAWCRERLASFKVPREVVVLDELPRNPTGKVLRRALKERLDGAETT